MYCFRTLVFIATFFSLAACFSSQSGILGPQPGMEAYVPARIAILPCQNWPSQAGFKSRPLSNAPDEDIKATCAKIDQVVLDGFAHQPFMKGYSPKALKASLSKAGLGAMLDAPLTSWTETSASPCQTCKDHFALYTEQISKIPAWIGWLNTLSLNSGYADATLIPSLLWLQERLESNQGVHLAVREASVGLFLLDTNNGRLIWSGRRTVRLFQPSASLPSSSPPLFPSWDAIREKLAGPDLWRGFPGRIEGH